MLPTRTVREEVARVAVTTQFSDGASNPAPGTRYDACGHNFPRMADLANWVLLEGADEGPPGYQYWYFAKTKTEIQRRTAVETGEDYQVVTWPPVLEGLRMVENAAAPVSMSVPSATDPSGRAVTYVNPIIPFMAIVPETTTLCQVRKEVFQSEIPFTGLNYPRPIPGRVAWNFGPAGSGSFVALHPDIRIKRPSGRYRQVADATPGFVDAPFKRDLLFPRTRFRTWAPYVLNVNITTINHLHIMERFTVYPPPKPKAVYD